MKRAEEIVLTKFFESSYPKKTAIKKAFIPSDTATRHESRSKANRRFLNLSLKTGSNNSAYLLRPKASIITSFPIGAAAADPAFPCSTTTEIAYFGS